MSLRFVVHGTPQTAGSKRAFAFKRKNGKLGARVTDDNEKSKPWKAAVASAAADAVHGAPLLRGPLAVSFAFYVRRPKGHFGARGLKPSAPVHPTVKPDVLKLARAVEDALTGVVWADDAQIVSEQLMKRYGEPERVEVFIAPAGEMLWSDTPPAGTVNGSVALPLFREAGAKLMKRMG